MQPVLVLSARNRSSRGFFKCVLKLLKRILDTLVRGESFGQSSVITIFTGWHANRSFQAGISLWNERMKTSYILHFLLEHDLSYVCIAYFYDRTN